jgi:serine/threonine protein kinase
VSLKAFDGRTLAIYLERLPPSLDRIDKESLSQPDKLRVLFDISSALVYLKTIPIVHNDVKPANITYSPQRGAVLIDFGLATSTNDWKVGGSPKYLPPDALAFSRGPPGDVWALGITMLYLLDKIPYPEKHETVPGWLIKDIFADKETKKAMETWLQHVSEARAELSPVNAGTTRLKLEYIVYNMLEVNSTLRFDAETIISTLASPTRF